jgi:signal transduction histidine kinase
MMISEDREFVSTIAVELRAPVSTVYVQLLKAEGNFDFTELSSQLGVSQSASS